MIACFHTCGNFLLIQIVLYNFKSIRLPAPGTLTNYPRRLCWSALIGFASPSIYLFVCPEHNSKPNDSKVFKLRIGNDLVIPYKLYCFGGSKIKGQGHRVSKFISHRTLHTKTAIHRHSLGGVTSRRSGIELGIECLLVKHCLYVFKLLWVLVMCSGAGTMGARVRPCPCPPTLQKCGARRGTTEILKNHG